MKLVIASGNAKKRAEIARIAHGLGIDILPLDATIFVPVTEDADTFAGNAAKKARAFAQANGMPALADDSGLCVDALGGAPGVRSARFAGPDASDAANIRKLLDMLQGERNRAAHFHCALHIALPNGRTFVTAQGEVHGEILPAPVGSGGFGYDPVFYCPELGMTFAEASPEDKARVSHRGRALRQLATRLADRLQRDAKL